MTSKLALVVTLCCALAGCKRAEKPAARTATTPQATAAPATPPAAPAATEAPRDPGPQPDWGSLLAQLGAPSLITLESTGEACNWSVLRPPQLDARLFLVTPTCPFNNGLVWDRRGGRFFFALERWLYVHDWQTGKVEKVAANPIGRDDPELGIASNGVLRLCDYQDRPIEVDVEVGFRVTMELQADGTWNNIHDERLVDGYASEPCAGPRDATAAGGVFYEPQPPAAAMCPQGTVSPGTDQCPTSLITDFLSSQVNFVNDGFEFVALGDGSFITYPTMRSGKQLRPTPPVFAITNTVTQLYDRVFENNQDADLAFSNDYFLVRAASDVTHATLFKKGELTPIETFPDTTRVFWIPGTIATETVVRLAPPQ